MDTQAIRTEIQKRIEADELLVSLDQVLALSNSTWANMANDGRIPVIRNIWRFLTLISLVNDAPLASMHEPRSGNPETREKMRHGIPKL